ncbi:ATP-binding protein [Gloeothece verrucosa]|uniref:AAA ATPase central domain protein n=1 Tax=Gloeothece verrucosa (strain PCC 7822) TaxID=497965 RepID=E0UCE6_GLOV7|nr:ATP-binding protein [Gloeothece verrucosa]ADN14017.1 AAA ATPase central domain protein [Gloeothece verrucosa PCC 7822]
MNNHEWQDLNKRYLLNALEKLRQLLEAKIKSLETDEPVEISPLNFPVPPALKHISQQFRLSSFEENILLLCAGMEFDGGWGVLCAKAQGDLQKPYPTFSLALATLPNPHWNALIPTAPLRQWRLLELGNSNSITQGQLWLDERITNYLAGISHLDERLIGLVEPVENSLPLVPSHQNLVEQIIKIWTQESQGALPIIQLCGNDGLTKRAISASVAQKLGLNLQILSAEILPLDSTQLNLIQCLCEREWLLSENALVLNCDYLDNTDGIKEGLIAHFIEKIHCPLIVNTRERRFQRERPLMTLEVDYPTTSEQEALWQNMLLDTEGNFNGQIKALVTHFNLNVSTISTVSWQFKNVVTENSEPSEISHHIWEICRVQSRPRLEELAQRIHCHVLWEDLILPEEERQVLQEITAHVRQRLLVYEHWGFKNKSSRGLGISVLFAGGSGTGKTLAAEVLGNELRLDVYRIDLSSVVSKYIGETEKNLRRIFDAAEGCGAILLFDEADALFGKRSEVKDSHDRYANMEVSYLLQRIEAYRGLAILTTNLKDAIDQAFLRRIRFIVQFPFPDATQRAAIWQTVFPPQTPTEGLDFQKLARLSVAGGNIRNIALNAAFLAADAGEAVQMKHILQATKSEYIKLEKTLTDTEIKGWVMAK